MNIVIRAQRREDDSAVRQVLTAAFKDDGRVAGLAEALHARPEPGAALVAVDGTSGIVGHVQLSVSWVDARTRLVEVLVLSPLAVAPTHQGRSIGARLLTAARDEAGRLNAPLLFLEGDPLYYSAHGWQRASELGFTRPSIRIPGPAFQVVTLPAYDPTMRGQVVYNDTFWRHDCVGLRGAELDHWDGASRNPSPDRA